MRTLHIVPSIIAGERDSLNRYMTEISRIELLSAEEEVILARRIREGGQNALRRLVNGNLRFVISCAKKYQHMGMPLCDLVNEGNLG